MFCSFERETSHSKMESLIKFVLFVIAIVPSFCRQCDEDIIGFRKLGMHRKSKFRFKVISAHTMHFSSALKTQLILMEDTPKYFICRSSLRKIGWIRVVSVKPMTWILLSLRQATSCQISSNQQ